MYCIQVRNDLIRDISVDRHPMMRPTVHKTNNVHLVDSQIRYQKTGVSVAWVIGLMNTDNFQKAHENDIIGLVAV